MKIAKIRRPYFGSVQAGAWKIMSEFDLMLLEYSDIEAIHYFCEIHPNDLDNAHPAFLRFLNENRITIYSKQSVINAFRDNEYTCILNTHFSRGIEPEIYARNTFTDKPFPIFSLSYDLSTYEVYKSLTLLQKGC